MNKHYSKITDKQKVKFLTILEKCKARRLKLYSQNELPEYLCVSLSKIKSFERGELFDFWLLCDYASICHYEMEFGIDMQILIK